MRRALSTGVAALALSSLAAGHARAIPPAVARALSAPSWPRALLIDPALAPTGAELAWERHGTTGAGATICVVDTGVDPRHRDLRDARGRTRVAWLADVGGAPRGERPDLEARYGVAIWSSSAIDAAIAAGDPELPGDRHGHGTAMASIAAGDDAESDARPGPHAGVAPEATLIVVRALREGALGLEDADVITGLELCFELTPDPARTVALLALGNHDGGHDGTSALERAVAAIAREHAVVVAAGNDGDRPIHASGRGLAGAPARIRVHVPTPREVASAWVALAVRTSSAIALRTPAGDTLDREGILEHRGGYLALARGEDGATRLVIGGEPLAGGDYELVIDEGPFDAWIVGASLGAALGGPTLRGDHVLFGETVTIPATAPGAIAVAATTTIEDLAMARAEARADGSATFSSLGPGVGSEPRPDLAAPGALIAAALSADLEPDDATNLVGGSRAVLDRARVGADRIAIAGSSASAAVVAGAHALAYALAPARPARDRALLFASAEPTPGRAWTAALGRGALRVDRWLDLRLATDSVGPIDPAASALSATRDTVLPGVSQVVVVARVRDASGAPIHGGELAIVVDGAELARAPIAYGSAEARVEVATVAGETIELRAEPIGAVVLASRIDEGARGEHATVGGGGCTVARGLASPRATAALFTLSLALARARAGSRAPRRRARRRPARELPPSPTSPGS